MRPILVALFLTCTIPLTGTSQIDSWKEVLNVKKATDPFRDSVTQVFLDSRPSVYHDSCIVFVVKRLIHHPDSLTYRHDIQVFESRDVGVNYNLIGHFTSLPWNANISEVIALSAHYMQSGDIILRADDHLMRYKHSSTTWEELFSPGIPRLGEDAFVPPHATKDIIISGYTLALSGVFLSEESNTLTPFDAGDNFNVTPTNVLFGNAGRRILFEQYDDVHAFSSINDGSPYSSFWSPALGVAFAGSLLGDDDCKQWEKYNVGKSNTIPAAITQNGTFFQFPPSGGSNVVLVSTNLGQQWDSVLVPAPSTDELMSIASNIGGRNLFLNQGVSGTLKMAECSTMSPDLRWPRNAVDERPNAQTLICPEKLAGEIEVEIDEQEDFASPFDHAITSERYHLVHGLSARTMYWWRYRYRPTANANWQAWSAPWHFSTGACTQWKYRHSTPPDYSGGVDYTRMLDGTLVRVEFSSLSIFTSSNQGTSWDRVASFQELSNHAFIESPSGKLIGKSGARWFALDLHTGNITWILQGYYSLEVFGNRLIAYTEDSVTTSTNEGNTWKKLPKLDRSIWSVYADVDGSILLGCSDILHTDNDTSKRYRQFGLYRYSPSTDSITHLSVEKRPYDDGNYSVLDRLRRLADGHLYTLRAQGSRNDILRSTDDGKTWTSVLPSFLGGDSLTVFPPNDFLTDRDQLPVMVMADNQHRRLYQGKWEIVDNGFQIRGAAVQMQSTNYRTLPDGTWSYSFGQDNWMCVQDPSIDQIKPRVNQVFNPGDAIQLQWNSADGADYYTVEIEPGNQTYQTTASAAMFSVPPLAPGRYTWRTRAHGVDGTAPWSAPSMFSIAGSTSSANDSATSASSIRNGIILSREAFRNHIHTMDSWPHITDICGRSIERWDELPSPVLLFIHSGSHQEVVILQD